MNSLKRAKSRVFQKGLKIETQLKWNFSCYCFLDLAFGQVQILKSKYSKLDAEIEIHIKFGRSVNEHTFVCDSVGTC